VAVRDRADRDQVVVDPSAGSVPLPLVSDLGPIVGAQLLGATSGWAMTAGRLAWTGSGGTSWRTITPTGAAGLDLLTAFFLDRRNGWLVAVDPAARRYRSAWISSCSASPAHPGGRRPPAPRASVRPVRSWAGAPAWT
jgi:hypothetical protein